MTQSARGAPIARRSSIWSTRTFAVVALFLVCVGMRSQLSGLPPLLPRIEAEFGTSHAWGGLLMSLSFAMMGLGALTASLALRSVGPVRGITIATAIIVLSGIARGTASDALVVAAVGVPLGLAVGLGTALLPVVTKERLPGRPGLGTGVYVAGLSVGSSLCLATAAPIADALGGWRTALMVFAAGTFLFALPWFAVPRGQRTTATMTPSPRWSSTLAWFPIAVFTLQAMLFFGLSTWIPTAYIELGWTETDAGLLGSELVLSSLFGSVAVAPLIDRREATNRYLIVSAVTAAAGCFGLVMLPTAGWLWTALAGASTGALFVLSFKLPLDLSDDIRVVARLTGAMLAVGYSISGITPLLLGTLRDASGSFTTSFVSLGALSLVLLVLSVWHHRRIQSP
jgi:CP family cyanate transporter-like MFS transporter